MRASSSPSLLGDDGGAGAAGGAFVVGVDRPGRDATTGGATTPALWFSTLAGAVIATASVGAALGGLGVACARVGMGFGASAASGFGSAAGTRIPTGSGSWTL